MRRFVVMAFMVAAMVAAVGFGTGSASAQSAPPVANPGGPYVGVVGMPITISGAASTGTNLNFAWTFCDGTTYVGAVVNKSFGTVGACAITLTVSNAAGQTSTASTTANIGGVTGGVCYPYNVCGAVVPTVVSTAVPTGCVLTGAGYVCGSGTFVNGCFMSSLGIVCNSGIGSVGFANCGFFGTFYAGVGCVGSFNGVVTTTGTNVIYKCNDPRVNVFFTTGCVAYLP